MALNASSVAFGKLSINPIVSASNTLGLAARRPTVVSRVENNLSSTSTSLPDILRKKLDFPALVYPAIPTVTAPLLTLWRRRSDWAFECFCWRFLKEVNSRLMLAITACNAVTPPPP